MKQQWLFMFVRLSWCVAASSLLSLPQVEVDIESHDHELLLTVRSLTACKLSEKQVDEALHVIFTFFFPLETLTDLTSPLFLSCMVPGVIMSLQWTAVATFLYIEVFFVLLLCIPFISPKRSEITSFFFSLGVACYCYPGGATSFTHWMLLISACLFLEPKVNYWTTAALLGTWSAQQQPEYLRAFRALRLKLSLLSVLQYQWHSIQMLILSEQHMVACRCKKKHTVLSQSCANCCNGYKRKCKTA